MNRYLVVFEDNSATVLEAENENRASFIANYAHNLKVVAVYGMELVWFDISVVDMPKPLIHSFR